LDEISLHKGHGQYVLAISAPEPGFVLDVLPNRNKRLYRKQAMVSDMAVVFGKNGQKACFRPPHMAVF